MATCVHKACIYFIASTIGLRRRRIDCGTRTVVLPVLKISTGCPTKNYTLFWRAAAPLNFELGIKVGVVLESSGSQLFKTVHTFDF